MVLKTLGQSMQMFSVSKIRAYAYKDLNEHGANQR